MAAPDNAPESLVLCGCGNMGGALLKIWHNKFSHTEFLVLDPADLPTELTDKPRIRHGRSPDDLADEIGNADVVVLAVKPQILTQVCAGLSPYVANESLVLSIAAGKAIKTLESFFQPGQPVVRAMPNTPAMIGEGMSVAAGNAAVNTRRKDQTSLLLEAAGRCIWIQDEALMHAVTALSGSGPAYIFYLIEILAQAGVEIGLPEKIANILARQTVTGSAALAARTPDIAPGTLRENVTSPGGTTEAALEVLMDGEVQALFTKALKAAKARSEDLQKK